MTPYQRQREIVAENIKRSYRQTELIKALEPDLAKGKKANVGEIRDWNGKKVQKTAQGWVEVNETGRKGESEQGKEISQKEKENAAILILKENGFMPSKREFLKSDKLKQAWDLIENYTKQQARKSDQKIKNPIQD